MRLITQKTFGFLLTYAYLCARNKKLNQHLKTIIIIMHNIVTEGYMPFMGYHTYYRIVGEASEKAPLLLLHGGPGSTHNYFEVLDRIAKGAVRLAETVQIGKGREKER